MPRFVRLERMSAGSRKEFRALPHAERRSDTPRGTGAYRARGPQRTARVVREGIGRFCPHPYSVPPSQQAYEEFSALSSPRTRAQGAENIQNRNC